MTREKQYYIITVGANQFARVNAGNPFFVPVDTMQEATQFATLAELLHAVQVDAAIAIAASDADLMPLGDMGICFVNFQVHSL